MLKGCNVKKFSATGRNHVVVIQMMKDVQAIKVPALYLFTPNGLTVLWPLITYFQAHSSKSLSWARNTARAVGLLYDYCLAVKHLGLDKREIYRRFILSFQYGTIDPRTKEDETGLYWPASSLRLTKKLRSHIIHFIDWQDREIESDSLLAKQAQRSIPPSLNEMLRAKKVAEFSMMAHVKDPAKIAQKFKQSQEAFGVDLGNDPRDFLGNQKSYLDFPSELIPPLFEFGFIKDPTANDPFEREDITAKMMTLLLVGGGLRKGEPHHLWFNDIVPHDRDGCRITLFHPSEAKTNFSGEYQTMTRREYLALKNLLPRNSKGSTKSHFSTWKNLAVDKRNLSATVYFLHESYAYLFWEMYVLYMEHYRPKMIREYKWNHGYDHPFLFVSSGHDRGSVKSYAGSPYSMAAYEYAFDKALDRLERHLGRMIQRGRDFGMNPHSLRHNYAKAMTEVGVSATIIQETMHHRTINAQEGYKQLSPDRVQAILAKHSIFPTISK